MSNELDDPFFREDLAGGCFAAGAGLASDFGEAMKSLGIGGGPVLVASKGGSRAIMRVDSFKIDPPREDFPVLTVRFVDSIYAPEKNDLIDRFMIAAMQAVADHTKSEELPDVAINGQEMKFGIPALVGKAAFSSIALVRNGTERRTFKASFGHGFGGGQ